jgi:excisionase family DNA binding protein
MANETLDYRDPDWVAQQLGIDKNAVYKLLNEGSLPALQIGRKWLISESSLVEFLKQEERQQTTARRAAANALWAGDDAARFDKFTEKARRTLVLAQQSAVRMNHNYIGQEHILLGMAEMPDCLAMEALANLGVTQATLNESVKQVVGLGREPVALGMLGLTPRAKRSIDLAVQQAQGLHHFYVGTEHLLLGLIAEGSGVGWGILTSLDMTLDKARAEIIRLLARGPAEGAEDKESSS